MKRGVTLLIDGDPLVYSCGFAAERTNRILNWLEIHPGEEEPEVVEKFATLHYGWRRDAFIELYNLHPDEFVEHLQVIPQPLPNALHILGDTIRRVQLACEGFAAEVGLTVGQTRVFLTGKPNYRDTVATIRGYKANRKDARRPYWYKELRRYMVERWDAEVTQGYEADDALSMIQWNTDHENPSTILCTIDKDLKMVPGLHYNYGTKKEAYIGWDDALLAFWRQLLAGDPTDNIPGLWKVGEKTAAKLLPRYTNAAQMYSRALTAYEENFDKFPDKHSPHLSGKTSLLENARLLWMLTHNDELWVPPNEPAQSLRLWLRENARLTDPDEELYL